MHRFIGVQPPMKQKEREQIGQGEASDHGVGLTGLCQPSGQLGSTDCPLLSSLLGGNGSALPPCLTMVCDCAFGGKG